MNTNFTFTFSPEISSFNQFNEEFKDVILPAKVFIDDFDLVIFGYFSSYDPAITEDNLAAELKKHSFKRMANSNCEYLLFVWDKQSKRLIVGLDNIMSFSCYFTVLDKQVVFSSIFSEVKNIVSRYKRLVADLDGLLTYVTNGSHATERTILEVVKMIPPGSVVEFYFEPKISYRIRSFVDVEEFSRSLSQEEFKDDRENYLKVLQVIKSSKHVITNPYYAAMLESQGDRHKDKNGIDEADDVFETLRKKISDSDCVVAEITTPSTSLGIQIEYALSNKIPVLCLFKKGVSEAS